jgi:hypothetical protein
VPPEIPPESVIGGRKFDDANGDGILDLGELGIEGWEIQLYTGDVLVDTAFTDLAGYYTFIVVDEGTYRIYEVNPSPLWVQTAPVPPGYHEFEVTLGEDITEKDFGNFKLAVVEGYKWNDLDGDGVWDEGEPGLSGWTIEATTDGDSKVTVTDEYGYYKFTFGPADVGSWTISEVLQPYWTQTCPSEAGTYTVSIYSGAIYGDQDFGNVKLITRSQGFWSTHYSYTWGVWQTSGDNTIASKTIDTDGRLFGAFWSSISTKTTGAKRTLLDQARMQLVQQLVAAMLNVRAFGDDGLGTGAARIAAGKAAFSGTDRAAILSSAQALAAFNESGSALPLPSGVDPGPADPKKTQAIADKVFWNSLP